MTRWPLLAVCAAILVSSCGRAPDNKDAVRQAMMEYLKNNAALDMNAVDIDIADVKFEGNQANARVAFKPKNAPEAGMTMSYTLERRGDKWQVKGKGAGHGGSMGMGGGGAMGGGGMGGGGAMGGGAAGGASGELPAGHPPVNSPGTPNAHAPAK